MSDSNSLNLMRKFSIIKLLFNEFGQEREFQYVDRTRYLLEDAGLLIQGCPHWCDRSEVLCKCAFDAQPAPDCIIAGVSPGDFISEESNYSHFMDIKNLIK